MLDSPVSTDSAVLVTGPLPASDWLSSNLKDDIKENIITKLSLDKGQGALIDTFDKLAEELVKRRFRAVIRFPAKRARV